MSGQHNPHRPHRRPGAAAARPSKALKSAPSVDISSAGLLVNVVRTLTTSASSDQRELETTRLEDEHRSSGLAIEKLVSEQQDNLSLSLQAFRKVSTRISSARVRIRNVRNGVSTARRLLQCRREDLQKLWVETAEQAEIGRLLERVERIRQVPLEAREAASRSHFLQSASLLREAFGSLENDLIAVDGLREMKEHVRKRCQELYGEMCEELNKLIYLRPTEELIAEMKVGTRAHLEPSGKTAFSQSGVLLVSESDVAALFDDGRVYEDLEEADPGGNPVQYLAILAAAIVKLGYFPAFRDDLPRGLLRGFTKLIHNTLGGYAEELWKGGGGGVGDAKNLAEVASLLFRQAKVVATLHGLLRQNLKDQLALSGADSSSDLGYSDADVWKQIQVAIQHFLLEYLDGAGGEVKAVAPLAVTNSSLSAFFAKKRLTAAAPVARKKGPLFRFTATTHSINVSAFNEDARLESGFELTMETPRETRPWLCPPSPQNLSALFRPLVKFAFEIEAKLKQKEPCQLRSFVEAYVMETYLPKIQQRLKQEADTALMSADAWSRVVGGGSASEGGEWAESPVAVLASSARTLELCKRVEAEMEAVPAFAERLAAVWLLILAEYQSRVQSVYEEATRSILPPDAADPEQWRKISAAWAVDEDISRLLKSLPNWLSLVADSAAAASAQPTPSAVSPPHHGESGHEIRIRNQRESHILIGNLGMQKKIEEWEIIQDASHIRSLAHIHESLEWFCGRVRRLVEGLPESTLAKLSAARVEISNIERQEVRTESLRSGLERRLGELNEMGGTCLLMLHLELRVHVFFHLLPLARRGAQMLGAREAQEADHAVLTLNRDLVNLHQLLGGLLQPRKQRFIFEGLGHLSAELLVSSAQHIRSINDNGKKRMLLNIAALQHCLCGLTQSREADLDRAKSFYQLLYLSPDEILDQMVEKGAGFGELEYRHLVSLAVRSHSALSAQPGALETRLDRLRRVLAERSSSS